MEKCIVKDNGYRVRDLIDLSEAIFVDGNKTIDVIRNKHKKGGERMHLVYF
jgi:hypothetical protein